MNESLPTWSGHLDGVRRELIGGWARDSSQPDGAVTLRILDNGVTIAEVTADRYRQDLEAAGIGNGRHAFAFSIPGGLSPDIRHLIEVRRAEDGRELPGSPFVLEVASPVAVVRSAQPAMWQGYLDTVSRERIEGWAWDQRAPAMPLPLVILDNGEIIARVLANRYRKDLYSAGMGDGRHAFSVTIPGGLSPLARHVIQVLCESDGCEMSQSPFIIAPAGQFDDALERAVSAAVSALADRNERERVLAFFAAQTHALLQKSAEASGGRERRLIHRQFERRWGKAQNPIQGAPVAPRRRALVVDDLLPAPDRDAGSNAVLSHMRALQNLDFEVSFVAAGQLSPPGAASAALEAQDIRCCQTPFYASVEEVMRRQRDCFDVVYLHRASIAAKYLVLARQYFPKARILYSVADLHHLRIARQAKVEGRPELLTQSRRLQLIELTAACHADVVITHSSAEAAWLRRAVKGVNVHVVPWAVPVRPTATPWNQRCAMAFIANFGHAPNLDATRLLVQQVLPRVREQQPTIECLLVGSNMPDSIKRLAAPGIVVMGHVPDLSTIYERVRLTVAPLRFGAGVKGKVLESLAAGVPCVMTPIAAEGIALPHPLASSIGADVAALAAHIVRVYSSESEFQTAARSGLAFIGAGFTEEVVRAGLKAAIEGRREVGHIASK